MVKKAAAAFAAALLAAACATMKPSPSSYYIEDIPASLTAAMTLDQRIAAEEVWRNLRNGNTERAKKVLGRESAANPAYLAGVGFVGLISGDLDSAESYFKQAVEQFPDMTPAYAGLAQVHEARGRKDQAFLAYREILKREPENKWAGAREKNAREDLLRATLDEAKTALAAGKNEEAKRAYLKALFYEPGHADSHLQLARLYRQEKDLKNAVFHAGGALERTPNDRLVLKEYAELLYEAEDFSRSLDAYERLAEVNPDDKTVQGRLAELRDRLGLFELPGEFEAIPSLEAIAREDLAALVAAKFKDYLKAEPRKPRVLVDIATSWAQKFIVRVASFDIMKAYENYTFQPKRLINRAELAETLVRLTDHLSGMGAKLSPVIDPRRVQLADVSEDNYYHPFILKAVSFQLLELTPQRTFEADRTVSGREAMAALDLLLRLIR
jgi:tetratricopeptide (TPR) repeat protein